MSGSLLHAHAENVLRRLDEVDGPNGMSTLEEVGVQMSIVLTDIRHLAESAPTLLDALEWVSRPYGMLDQAVHNAPPAFGEAMLETARVARAAIAKARGDA